MKHVALVTCPYPAARILNIDASAALKMPGVHCVLDGRELAAGTTPLMAGLDTPNVPRRPLAVDVARYAGEWVAAVIADTRALAEDAAEKVESRIPAAALRARRRRGVSQRLGAGARGARLERAARQDLRLGRGRKGFRRQPASREAAREMGGAVRPCLSRPSACSRNGIPGAKYWISGLRSRCPNMPSRLRAR